MSDITLSKASKKIDNNFDRIYVRYLQFRLLHRRISTNELFKSNENCGYSSMFSMQKLTRDDWACIL